MEKPKDTHATDSLWDIHTAFYPDWDDENDPKVLQAADENFKEACRMEEDR